MKTVKRFIHHMLEWREVLAVERFAGENPSKLTMFGHVLRGVVTQRVWRRRMRVCLKCPVFNHELRQCRASWPMLAGATQKLGCGCYVVFLAKVNAPYTSVDGTRKGCWGRAMMGGTFGWE
jgi:hypothetical protein